MLGTIACRAGWPTATANPRISAVARVSPIDIASIQINAAATSDPHQSQDLASEQDQPAVHAVDEHSGGQRHEKGWVRPAQS